MTDFTPGPWTWQRDTQQLGDDFVAVYADAATGDHIRAQILGNNMNADARLIAAAPDLLATLHGVRELAEDGGDVRDITSWIDAAIAKAEGSAEGG